MEGGKFCHPPIIYIIVRACVRVLWIKKLFILCYCGQVTLTSRSETVIVDADA